MDRNGPNKIRLIQPLTVHIPSPIGEGVWAFSLSSTPVNSISMQKKWTIWLTLFVGFFLLGRGLQAQVQSYAYVANTLSADVTVLDLNNQTVVSTIPVGAIPIDIAISPDSSQLAVICALGGDTVVTPNFPNPDTTIGSALYLIETSTNTVSSVINLSTSSIPSDVAYSPSGDRFYVSFLAANAIEVLDMSGNFITNISFAGGPTDLAFRPGTNELYVLQSSLGRYGSIDATTNTATALDVELEGLSGGASTNPFSFVFSPDGNTLIVPNSSSSFSNVVDLTTTPPTVSRVQEDFGGFPSDAFMGGSIDAVVTPDGTKALITEESTGELSIVNLDQNNTIFNSFTPADDVISFGFTDQPIGVAVSRDGQSAVVALSTPNQVALIDLATRSFVTLSVGNTPRDVVALEVFICPSLPVNQVSETVCANDLPFTFGSQSLTTAGVFTDTFTLAQGFNCDSIVELTLTVNPTFADTVDNVICDSELPFSFGTQTLTMGGTFIETFSSVTGCDSVVTLNLTVNSTFTANLDSTVCDVELPITLGTQTISAAGNYTEVFQAANGCDSTINLNLTVNPTFAVTDSAFICQGQTLIFGSQVLDSSGTYNEVFSSAVGCDSAVTLILVVGNKVVTNLSATICDGESFTFDGQQLTVAGEYTDSLVTSSGCDSIVVLNLSVDPTFAVTLIDSVCEDILPITFGTQIITMAGIYTETFTAATGCDSVVTLELVVNPVFALQIADTVCDSELPITLGTQTITSAGSFTEVFVTSAGCDSTVTLDLVVNPTFSQEDTLVICEDELPITLGTQTITASGDYTEVFATSSGCDSTVLLNLVVNPIFNVNVSDTVQANDLPFIFGIQSLDESGTYTEVFETVDGCDSTVTLALLVDSTTSIDPGEIQQFTVRIYPNPTSDMLHVAFDLHQAEDVTITIFDLSGRRVYNYIHAAKGAGTQLIQLDLANLSKGLYIAQVTEEQGSVSQLIQLK